MKKTMKSMLTLLLVATLIVLSGVPTKAAETRNHLDYVAMGDSVAAGVLLPSAYYPNTGYPNGKSGYGYTDIIANQLDDLGVLESFSMEFAEAGKTAKELAEETKVLNIPGSPKWHLVKNAEIVTLNIGANDLLGGFYQAVGGINNIQAPQPNEIAAVMQAINDIQVGLLSGKGQEIKEDIKTILQNILNANKNVKIFVMGYYNPLPVISTSLGINLNPSVVILNNCIQDAIKDVNANNKHASINYVPTMEVMASTPGSLYPLDIHPSVIGYEVIAEEFLSQIKLDILKNK